MPALSSLVDIVGGGTPSKQNPAYWNGDIPWVSVKDFKSSILSGSAEYITSEGVKNSATTIISAGNLIVPTRMALGKVAINIVDVAINQDLKALIIKDKGVVDRDYLMRALESKAGEIEKKGKGATVKGITLDVLKNLEIPLPPLGTQKQIAIILEKADQLRKDCQQMEQELNNLAQSVFMDMFGDPVSNPKGWDVVELSSICEVKGGLQVTSKRSGNPIEVPYLRVANVYRDKLLLDEIKTIRVTEKELERTSLCTGDILFVEGHGNKNEVGRASVWNGEIELCTHQNHLIRCRPFDSVIPEYLSAYANSSSGRRQLLSMSKTTSGLNTLSTSNISDLKILLPPRKLQQEYLDKVSCISKRRIDIQNLASEYDLAFAALMQKAFSGELTIKDRAA